MDEAEPTTEELRAVQRKREATEREAAREAPTEDAERAHARRAEKAAYLQERLAAQQRADEERDDS